MVRNLLTGMALLFGAAIVQAEQSVDTGDYVVHYNALSTAQLPAQVARAYGIKRSSSRALLNVSVQKKDGETTQSVTADVVVGAINLTGQSRQIEMKLIEEQDARYYIGTVGVSNEETLRFDIKVLPQERDNPIEIRFDQKFFTD